MTEERIEDEWRIRRTLERYCRAVDDLHLEGIVGAFTADAVIEIGGESLCGEAAITEYYSRHGTPGAHPIGVHLLGNCIVDFEGEDLARAETDFLQVWRVGEGSGEDAAAVIGGTLRSEIPVAGRYRDQMRREPEGWRIGHRSILLFATMPYKLSA